MSRPHVLTPHNLIAHRGHAAQHIENTYAAIAGAIDCGARFVEIDVQLSSDRIPMVFHDRTLDKLARIKGTVGDFTCAQLQASTLRIDATPERAMRQDRIWSLAEIVPLLQSHAEINLFVELKRISMLQFGVAEVVAQSLEVLAPIRDQCVIISYASEALRYARAQGISRVGWVMEPWDDDRLQLARELAPEYLFTDHNIIPASALPLPEMPWQWALYEIGSLELAQTWRNRGAQLLETFRIGEIIAALES